MKSITYAPLAQWTRALGYEPRGRGFESLTGCQKLKLLQFGGEPVSKQQGSPPRSPGVRGRVAKSQLNSRTNPPDRYEVVRVLFRTNECEKGYFEGTMPPG